MEHFRFFDDEEGAQAGGSSASRGTLAVLRDVDSPQGAIVAAATDDSESDGGSIVRRPDRPVCVLVQATTAELRRSHTKGLGAATATDVHNIRWHDLHCSSLPSSLSIPANSITLSYLYNVETLPPMAAKTIKLARLDKLRALPALSGVCELSISSTPLTTIPSNLCLDRLLVDAYQPPIFGRRPAEGPRSDVAFRALMASFKDACLALLGTIPPERLRCTLIEGPSAFRRVTFLNLDAPTWSQNRPSGAPTYPFRECVMPHDWARQWLESHPARRGRMPTSPVPAGVDAECAVDIIFDGRTCGSNFVTSLPPLPLEPVNSILASHLHDLRTLPAMAARTISITRLDRVRELPPMSGVRELRLVGTPIVSIPTTLCLDVLHAGGFEGIHFPEITHLWDWSAFQRVEICFKKACLSLLDTLPAERLVYMRAMRPREAAAEHLAYEPDMSPCITSSEHPPPDEPVAKIAYLDAPIWSEDRPSDAPMYPFREFIMPFNWFQPWLDQHPACHLAQAAVDSVAERAPLASATLLRGPLPTAQPTFELAVTSWRQALHGLDFPTADVSEWGLNDTQTTNFRVFLNGLLETRDYQNQESRPRQIWRVDHMFQILDYRPELRSQFAALAMSGTLGCADMATWALNNMDVAVGIEDAKNAADPEAAMRALAAAHLRLAVVREHAMRISLANPGRDQAEIFLAMETRLRESTALPVTTEDMLHRACAALTESEYQAARTAAIQAADDPQRLNTFMAAWEPYCELQRPVEAEHYRWALLPSREIAVELAATLRCTITQQDYADLSEPVLIAAGNVIHAFESADFLTWWVLRGTNPNTKQPLALSEVWRPCMVNSQPRRIPVASGGLASWRCNSEVLGIYDALLDSNEWGISDSRLLKMLRVLEGPARSNGYENLGAELRVSTATGFGIHAYGIDLELYDPRGLSKCVHDLEAYIGEPLRAAYVAATQDPSQQTTLALYATLLDGETSHASLRARAVLAESLAQDLPYALGCFVNSIEHGVADESFNCHLAMKPFLRRYSREEADEIESGTGSALGDWLASSGRLARTLQRISAWSRDANPDISRRAYQLAHALFPHGPRAYQGSVRALLAS
ncbi:C-terminal E3 ligase [Aspergillus bertholletiae]|uniref:C-terminal E3 ligase n=1 Tax=Aspergillus bertholletiae TaxID=1226010 RepID=A0A5N7B8T5_9EURO|nr:C-terminal E3 ligase [Aspergillus bertholletiae]